MLSGARHLLTEGMEKAVALDAAFVLDFIGRTCLKEFEVPKMSRNIWRKDFPQQSWIGHGARLNQT